MAALRGAAPAAAPDSAQGSASARLPVAVLISGRGSNMQALVAAARDPRYPAQVALVVSNDPKAAGLAAAAAAGIATAVVPHRDFPSRIAFDEALDRTIRAAGCRLICLAGFMRLLTAGFVEAWRDRMINVHPSLLPSFKGLDTHARALAAGVKLTGCTVHFVRPAMDEGPIIAQAAVAIRPDDDADRLAARVLAAEHRLYPLALRLVAEGRVRIEGERAVVDAPAWPEAALLAPSAA
ncbi:MAG: phosphoribosylglycinamide formyltransferase [Alphaproteobacteria bacterium]|nr:phosphoribosylglycinamide formyltransferase [Alphaproteobacteria bacterium]